MDSTKTTTNSTFLGFEAGYKSEATTGD